MHSPLPPGLYSADICIARQSQGGILVNISDVSCSVASRRLSACADTGRFVCLLWRVVQPVAVRNSAIQLLDPTSLDLSRLAASTTNYYSTSYITDTVTLNRARPREHYRIRPPTAPTAPTAPSASSSSTSSSSTSSAASVPRKLALKRKSGG